MAAGPRARFVVVAVAAFVAADESGAAGAAGAAPPRAPLCRPRAAPPLRAAPRPSPELEPARGDDAPRETRGRPAGLARAPNLDGGVAPSRERGVALELWLIGFYKDWISPVLPRACRFVPTCSSYGEQAYEEYGAARGLVLTAWRIARCNPLGGSGFDPPCWPPPAWGAGSSSWWRRTPFWRDD
ncbi:hypothetical protein KFE25_003793 [Diacronema lutheri]|uniref:Membrane protein insertion efficiency factor n=1 Tax=Diacronema lutheri TaxID=2081491 RepID=A0A8J5X6H3_DIALT|nr:hypothetical protein KFE25_003793 [Diacronema lutheri]